MSPNENELHAFNWFHASLSSTPSTLGNITNDTIDTAIHVKLHLGGKVGLAVEEAEASEAWHVCVRRVRGLGQTIGELDSTMHLRRAHPVLAYVNLHPRRRE